jgi:hypothetical protein
MQKNDDQAADGPDLAKLATPIVLFAEQRRDLRFLPRDLRDGAVRFKHRYYWVDRNGKS